MWQKFNFAEIKQFPWIEQKAAAIYCVSWFWYWSTDICFIVFHCFHSFYSFRVFFGCAEVFSLLRVFHADFSKYPKYTQNTRKVLKMQQLNGKFRPQINCATINFKTFALTPSTKYPLLNDLKGNMAAKKLKNVSKINSSSLRHQQKRTRMCGIKIYGRFEMEISIVWRT